MKKGELLEFKDKDIEAAKKLANNPEAEFCFKFYFTKAGHLRIHCAGKISSLMLQGAFHHLGIKCAMGEFLEQEGENDESLS